MIATEQPLDGVRVLEAGPLLPVPSAGANLQRLGAAITRIESPSGDPAKTLYGGWLHELYGHDKAIAVLDLTTDEGRDELADHVARTDVVIVGYRPAAARRLGLDADNCLRLRPDLVHCSVVGYATSGPDADRPGHDLSFLARCGALAEPAGPSAVGSPPRRPAVPVADLAAGAVATQAILAALLARATGRHVSPIEIPIADVALAWMAPRLGHAVDARFPAALDPANDIYVGSDGRSVVIAAIEPRFWSALCRVIEDALGELADGLPAGAIEWTSARRIGAADELAAALRVVFAQRPASDWLEWLGRAGVPVDPVLDAHEVVAVHGVDLDGWRERAVPLPGFGSGPTG